MEKCGTCRLVVVGGKEVGKTCIIHRYLFNTFNAKHKKTVEDLYCKTCCVSNQITFDLDIVDTAGTFVFPAMRRLRLATANAFLLVYNVCNHSTFVELQNIFKEIKEIRSDFEDVPVVIAGNKIDLEEAKVVSKDSVSEWVYIEVPNLRFKIIECSAKTNKNIKEIFKAFLYLVKLTNPEFLTENVMQKSSSFRFLFHSTRNLGGATSFPEEPKSFQSGLLRNGLRSRSLVRKFEKKSSEPIRESYSDDCHIS